MNILIPNSWLQDYLETNATPQQFADAMSLTSVSIEKMEKVDDDIVYDIEVTTNRPDLMSVHGIAREASAVLPQAGYTAKFKPKTIAYPAKVVSSSPLIAIKNDPTLVNRIVAVVMEIELNNSPTLISKRLEHTGIRSINNVVDITNYIMREIGHPSHVFDFDRLTTKKLIIRKSKKGERIATLDDKEYELAGGDIVADDGTGKIVDLLGIMGTANSAVTKETKRILLFLDNNNPHLLRKTSMGLGIRSEAAVLNEKGISPEIMLPTLLYGIELIKKYANGTVVSDIIDIYPNKPEKKKISINFEKINSLIGVSIPEKTVSTILDHLGFKTTLTKSGLNVEIPPVRLNDIDIPEDIIEEVARVYGYHKIPNILPTMPEQSYSHQEQNEFYWITKIKEAFKFWGFTEVYTYSMVAEELYEGPIEEALRLKNPLDAEHVYMRNTLTPSVLQIISENKKRSEFHLFEIANVYIKNEKGLPDEKLHLTVVIKKPEANFPQLKGVVEQLFKVLGITNYKFSKKDDGIEGAKILVGNRNIGQIEVEEELSLELDLSELIPLASAKKVYTPPAKFPPIIEDITIEIAPHYTFQEIKSAINSVTPLVDDVTLIDVYENKKTFRITYLDRKKSLTNEDIAPLRNQIAKKLDTEFKAKTT